MKLSKTEWLIFGLAYALGFALALRWLSPWLMRLCFG